MDSDGDTLRPHHSFVTVDACERHRSDLQLWMMGYVEQQTTTALKTVTDAQGRIEGSVNGLYTKHDELSTAVHSEVVSLIKWGVGIGVTVALGIVTVVVAIVELKGGL